MILPYLNTRNKYERFSANNVNQILGECLASSAELPCYLEVSGATRYFLFFRERQIYSAGKLERDQFSETTIKEFLQATLQSQAQATCCQVNNKILHSLLILFQKRPALKLLTSIVDLDAVLDKIEEDRKSCIVSASHHLFLALLRYEKGEVTALCHERSQPVPNERSFREDFLVRIYTLSAETPLTISVYEDLLVKYAGDAKMIEDGYGGDITEMYLARPPIVSLEFKDTEIGQWVLDRPSFNIGRTTDNDIVIDNLAVSRLHAVLECDKGEYFIRDCDSLNGTLVNSKKVGRARLEHGDEIMIGKHRLKFNKRGGTDLPAAPNSASFDQTVIINPTQRPAQPRANSGPQTQVSSGPRLVEKTKSGDVVIELNRPSLVLGKNPGADVEIEGLLIARHHAEIVKESGDYVIRHVNGHRKVTVGGKTVTECVLQDNDEIRIGKSEFVFRK
jgi:pSer/pThr/pTyr-binding forkhead associated (FHA) protein